jgi:hypothetical protein
MRVGKIRKIQRLMQTGTRIMDPIIVQVNLKDEKS